ncbi:hypothetical protein [Polynucleobacter ibericus]|uniref:hypothetical protein n=1 Tax=Polynucleobacter ibericus TaxID=1819725 RepID=UPI001BFCE824|nr:hypothetical protein [Polynucleobacter ibericus]QWE08312.1 DUF4149 domain-containing protein [Polynucleobacter ibericus]
MVEVVRTPHVFAFKLLRFLAYILAGGVAAQAIGCLSAYVSMTDSQAAGMVANIVVQHLAYYFLGCAFVILSLANILIKRGIFPLKTIRLPALIFMLAIALASFLFIPRMDYLRETALLDGMPVMLSPFANYFQILNVLVTILLFIQMITSALMAWRLTADKLAQVQTNSGN